MGKTTVIYRDIAVGAQDDAAVVATVATPESIPAELPHGFVDDAGIISFDLNKWTLDGTQGAFYEKSNIAFWSIELSDADTCKFSDPPVITATFDEQYTSTGITLTFDPYNGDYCDEVNIKWYQGDTLKANVDFTPNDAIYFCAKNVEAYNKVVITLNKTHLPQRRARLSHILFGATREFGMDELRSASIINEMDESSIEMPISTLNWTLDSRTAVDYLFQLKQPVEVWNNENLIGVYYVDGSTRTASRVYDIDCTDALGVLSESNFPGGVYLDGISAKTLIEKAVEPFTVTFDEKVSDTQLKGLLEEQDRRSAIQQIAFAWGVCVATDGGNVIRVFQKPDSGIDVPPSRTFTGTTIDTSAVVTAVQITAHTYTVDSNGNIKINDVNYADKETVYTVKNPDITASDRENVKSIKDATLVSVDNGQAVAQRIYDYYSNRDKISAKIIYSGERLGDYIGTPLPWTENDSNYAHGNLHKMEIKLSNTVVMDIEVNS